MEVDSDSSSETDHAPSLLGKRSGSAPSIPIKRKRINLIRRFSRTGPRGFCACGNEYKYMFLEVCSGSGRLTAEVRIQGLTASDPLDIIHGHDLSDRRFIAEVKQRLTTLRPFATHIAVKCRPWSVANQNVNTEDSQYAHDMALAVNLAELAGFIADLNLFVSIENPARSRLWQLDCYEKLRRRVGFYMLRADMCMFGATHKLTGQPVWKGLEILCNMPWLFPIARVCSRDHRYTSLEGQHTRDSQVYPLEFCREYVKLLKAAPDTLRKMA